MRKKYIISLENRTPKQIAEEEALYIEIKHLEQNERKFKKDREDLLRTLVGIESGLPDIPADEEGQVTLINDTKRKKRMGSSMELESPLTPNIISLGLPITKRVQTAKSATYGKTCPPLSHGRNLMSWIIRCASMYYSR
jgi:DNA methyltransferase 1-associated protein 1